MKKFIPVIAITLVLAFCLVACNGEPENDTGPTALKGTVTIPFGIMIGKPVTANLSWDPTGKESYLWEASADEMDGYQQVGTDSQTFTATEGGLIQVDNYLRVTVTRSDRTGSIFSNPPSIIYPLTTINSVAMYHVNTPLEDGFQVNIGKTYNFTAVVTHDDSDPDIFQEVNWEIFDNSGTPFPKNGTSIGISNGRLVVGSQQATSFSVKATSVYDSNVTATATFEVLQDLRTWTLDPIIKGIEIRDIASVNPTLNDGAAAFGAINPVPTAGGSGWFARNAKIGDNNNDSRMEIFFNLENFIDALPYNFLTYEIAADNEAVLEDIVGHYPRFRQSVEPNSHTQTMVNTSWRALIQDQVSGNGQPRWVRMVVPINEYYFATGQTIHEHPQNWEIVLGNFDQIGLRYIASPTKVPGTFYFRNLQLHKDIPN